MIQTLRNVHPGEVLLEEFLKPLGISQNKLANDIGVTPRRITADTAIRLAYYFGVSEEFWMGLQDDYELEEAHHHLKNTLKTIIHPLHVQSS